MLDEKMSAINSVKVQPMAPQAMETYHKLPSIDQECLLALLDSSGTDAMNALSCLHAIGWKVVGITSRDAAILGCIDKTVLAS